MINLRPRNTRLSLLVAISTQGILGFQIFDGSVKSGDFGQFMIHLIVNNPYISINLSNFIFYMDNARIHHAKIL